MDRDPLVRLFLFGILAALIALVAKTGDGGGPIGGGGARFALDATHAGSPVMFRIDTQTGQTWKLELRGGNDRWRPIYEPDEEETEPAGPPHPHQGTPRVPEPQPRAERYAPPPPPSPAPAPGRTGPEWDLALLAYALEDPAQSRDVRVWSAGRLALQDVPESTEALLAVQGDEDAQVVAAALTALKGRSDARIEAAVRQARSHADPSVQAAAAALSE